MSTYDDIYYARQVQGAMPSARAVVPHVYKALRPASVTDFGCGRGAWLRAWTESGVADIRGVDGAYVQPESLLIPAETFVPHDLTTPFPQTRTFDYAQSLEVAEHLPHDRAHHLVEALVAAAPIVLFGAAVRGQGGESHINEQPIEYWRQQFRKFDYVPFDYLRPLIRDNASVEPWYRFNTILYVRHDHIARLAPEVSATRVADNMRIDEGGSLSWRARRAVVSILPRPIVNQIARTLAATAGKPKAS